MKVMSFNVLCSGKDENCLENRKRKVVKILRDNMPDIFGLQEAHWEWMQTITSSMPEYLYVGVGRDDGLKAGEFSPVFFKKEKFNMLDNGTFWLSETPKKPSKGWDSKCIRICSYGVFEEIETGNKLIFLNTHLDHVGEKAQVNGARLIADFSERYEGIPAIMTGDFNTLPSSDVHKIICEKDFKDARLEATVSDETYTFHGFEKLFQDVAFHQIIDYIFVKNFPKVNSFKVINDKVDGYYPSDHFPIIADIEF